MATANGTAASKRMAGAAAAKVRVGRGKDPKFYSITKTSKIRAILKSLLNPLKALWFLSSQRLQRILAFHPRFHPRRDSKSQSSTCHESHEGVLERFLIIIIFLILFSRCLVNIIFQ